MATTPRRRRPRLKPTMSGPTWMMLGQLYAEEKGGAAPSPWPDDGAYKSWNHHNDVLKKLRLITAPTRKQIYAGNPPPTRITPKGVAEYERIRATPEYPAMLAEWEEYCAVWKRLG